MRRFAILDTPREEEFDRIAALAGEMISVPIALVSFVDQHRRWFKAAVGSTMQSVPREQTLCNHAIRQTEILVLPDIHADKLFEDPDLVRFDRSLRFYAGAPLITADGERLGTLCVLDRVPRPDFGARESRMLTNLAAIVVNQLELRRERMLQERQQAEAALIRDIQGVLVETSSFGAAMQSTMRHILNATPAAYCQIWERREGEDVAHLLAFHAGDSAQESYFDPLRTNLPIPLEQMAITSLFEGAGSTMWRILQPRDERSPRMRQAMALGVTSVAACSLIVGDRRFAMLLGFQGTQNDLPEVMAQLERLSHAVRPVLERNLADEQLALLGSALAATHDGVMIFKSPPLGEAAAKIVFVNAALTAQTGYTAAEILGATPCTLYGPQTCVVERQRICDAMLACQPVRSELLHQRRDGSLFWGEQTVVPITDDLGRQDYFVAILRDITDNRAEAEAQEQRERAILAAAQQLRTRTDQLSRTQRIAKLGTWRWTMGSDTLDWSDTIYPMFGVTPAQFTPTLATATALIHPDDMAAMRARINKWRVESYGSPHEFRTIGPDDVVRHIWTDCTCETDEAGYLTAVSGIAQDITERKESEAMLLHAEKLRSIGQLTGGIAHDFNNMLTVISVNLEIMGDMIGPDHEAEKLRAMALRAAESGARLTANLLAFARRQPLQPQPVDIGTLLGDIRLLAAPSIGERHPISVVLAPYLPRCLLDRAGLEGVVLNLLVNSRDAMPDGGRIRISAHLCHFPNGTSGARIKLDPGDYVAIEVADTGIGIPPELQQRVFEPFFTTKVAGKGTGLGLSTVIGFVRQSGGEVELISTPGLGTKVRLYLPAWEEEA